MQRRVRLGWGIGLFLAVTLGATRVEGAVAVLIPGYLGDAATWRDAGITAALVSAGWRDGGMLAGQRAGSARPQPGNVFYIADAPSEAPLLYQAQLLHDSLEQLYRNGAQEPLILIGHSAGGVVARLFMVQYGQPKVRALITIASPHLGTETAELGLMTSLSPLGFFAPLVGAGTLNKSRALYADLAPERPGDLLYWLNRQAHPDSRYISVVRTDKTFLANLIVSAQSQDMNNVYALRGRAQTVTTSDGHGLDRKDGPLLVGLLKKVTR